MAAHERAFAHFGGVCQTLLYDRMRTVALGIEVDDAGRVRSKLNAKFEAFAQHWGFAIRLCRPYRPQTKGKVESGVKYLKRNFVPGRTFTDLEDFNAQLSLWQAQIADQRIHGTTHQRPIDRFKQELTAMLPAIGHRSFVQAMVRERVVAEDWLVSVEANRYSVPFRLIGRTVQITREADQWVMRYQGRVVAEHAVLAGRAQLSVKPEHGPGPVTRNRRQRFAQNLCERTTDSTQAPDVQVRELSVYEQILNQREAA